MTFVDWLYLALQVAAIIGGLIGGVSGFVVFLLKNSFVTHKELTGRFADHLRLHAAIDEKLGHGAIRFTRIDGEVKHVPTHEDIEGLRRDIAELRAALAALDASTDERGRRMERIEVNVDRLLDFHLQGAK
jgi:hypothetical protein